MDCKEISGYKSINKERIDLNSVNVLIGANGSGKSNFISFFTLLNRLYNRKLNTFIELATIAAKGTKMPRADWAFLEKLELKIPPPELLKRYQARFEKIFSLISTLLKANEQAKDSRDLLLPRLISGKLSVADLDIQFPPSMQEEITESGAAHA